MTTDKEQFKVSLSNMDGVALRQACREYIWLSSYAANNPHSNYHWKCTACYDECVNSGRENIYASVHQALVRENTS